MRNWLRRGLPFWKYEGVRIVFWWGFLSLSYVVFALLVHYQPKIILAMTDVIKPVSKWVTGNLMGMLWDLTVPESVRQQVTQARDFLAPVLKSELVVKGVALAKRKTAEVMGDRAQAAAALMFGGFILISLSAWLLRLPVSAWLFKKLRKDVLATSTETELLAELERRKS